MTNVDFKVVLLGAATVGKTSLVQRFVNEHFNGNLSYQNTIGAAFSAKQVTVDGKDVVIGLWDTAGCERYNAMTRIYYRGAKAAVVCYDSTLSYTFQKAKYWISELRSVEQDCKIYISATKFDISDENLPDGIKVQVARDYADGIQAKLFFTSSKTGENVEELFHEIVRDYSSNPNNLRQIEKNIKARKLTASTERKNCCYSS